MSAVIAGRAATRHAAFTAALEELAAQMRKVTAHVHTRGQRGLGGVGAGVLWSADGLVVTNAHVVAGVRGDWPIVELTDGRSFEARLVARDEQRDLALLALERSAQPFDAVALGDARALRVGELLVAVGHPFGIAGSVSVGVVHALRADGWLRADIRLAPGNSGGPLATLDGGIVGINCMVVRGLGVAIATHVVADFVDEATAGDVGVRGDRDAPLLETET